MNVSFPRSSTGLRLAGSLLGVLALQLPSAAQFTTRIVRETGPSENRFDLVILAEGYRSTDQGVFNQDVDDLVLYLASTQPFARYFDYLNIRSGFQPSPCHVGSCGLQQTTYNAVFLPDTSQVCGNLQCSPNGANPTPNCDLAPPINIPLALSHAQLLGGADPGGILVLIHDAPGGEIKYGGLGLPGVLAIASNNRVPRSNFNIPTNLPPGSIQPVDVSKLRFPELAVHELGHSIGGLADETGTFGALPFCPLPEPNSNDFLEINVSRFLDRSRFVRWLTRWDQTPLARHMGGLGSYGNCGSATTWPVVHMNDFCMMNLLNAGFCPVCAEEMVIQLHERAGLTPNELSPPTDDVTLTASDGLTCGFNDLTLGGPKDVNWRRNGFPLAVGPHITQLNFGFSGPGTEAISLTINDRGEETTSTTTNMISSSRLAELRVDQDWTVTVIDDPPAGPELISAVGQSTGYPTLRLGSIVEELGDINGDGFSDLGITSETKAFGMSGQDGSALFEIATQCGNTCWEPQIVGLEDNQASNSLFVVTGMQQLKVDVYALSGTNATLLRTVNVSHHPFSLANIGDVNLDGADDFAVAGFNNLQAFSGRTGAQLFSNGSFERTPSGPNLGRFLIGLGTDASPSGGDGRPDLVVFEENPGNSTQRSIRCRSGLNGFELWSVALPNSVDAYLEAVGDVNIDGVGDFLLTIPDADVRFIQNAGNVTLRSGVDGSILRTFEGTFIDKELGQGVGGLGDVNGDGVPDFAMTRVEFPAGTFDYNLVDVISGSDFSLLSSVPGTRFGHGRGMGISGLADRNGDGRREIAIADQFGGTSGNPAGRVRVFSALPLPLAETEVIGSGCPGSDGSLPELLPLAPNDIPRLGLTFVSQATNLPPGGGPHFGLFAFAPLTPPLPLDNIGMTGCFLYLDAPSDIPLPGGSSTANWAIPIPNDPVLVGFTAYLQVFVVDPGANPFNATTTNALRVTVGI